MSKLVRPDFDVRVDGQRALGSSVSVVYALDSYPVCEIVAHPNASGIRRIEAEEAADMFSSVQEAIKEARPAAVRVSISDGRGGNLSFEGAAISINYGGSVGNVAPRIRAVHTSAQMDGFRPHIYSGWAPPNQKPSSQEVNASMAGVAGVYSKIKGSVAARMAELLTEAQKNTTVTGSKTEVAVAAAINAHNIAVAPLVWQMLEASNKNTDKVQYDSLSEADNYYINLGLFRAITSGASSFLESLLFMGKQFQCSYVPAFADTPYGYLANHSVLYGGSPQPLSVPVMGMSMSDSSPVIYLPMTNIAVRAAGASAPITNLAHSQDKPTTSGIIALYPEEIVVGGLVMEIDPPSWMAACQMDLSTTSSSFAFSDPTKRAKEVIKAAASGVPETVESRAQIIKVWAQEAFERYKAASTKQTLQLPLDLTVVPGRRYNVSAEGGGSLFTGTASSVTHVLSRDQRAAQTSIDFTHIA